KPQAAAWREYAMPIAKTQKTFLVEVLKVTPKKKKLLGKGKGDDQTQATTAFDKFRQKEKAVRATIVRLEAIAGSEEDVAALEGRVARAQRLLQSADKGNAADVKAKCDQAAADLDGIDADAKAAISKHKANQANLVRLSKERDAYTMAATKARTQLELLAVIP